MDYTQAVTVALDSGDVPAALAILDANEAAHGAEPEFCVAKAMVFMVAGDAPTAQKLLEAGVQAHPNDGDMWYSLGSVYYATEQAQPACRAYGRAEALLPEGEMKAQAAALCSELSAQAGMTLTTLTEANLRSMNFYRAGKTQKDIEFLLLRIQLDVGAAGATKALKDALKKGYVTMETLRGYI